MQPQDASHLALSGLLNPADDLLEALEPVGGPEFEGSSPAGSQAQLSQPGAGGSLSQRSDGAEGWGEGAVGPGWRQLTALLGVAAEASGALAAVDAVQYVSGLALQQAQQLRQQHCSELAAFQWANDHLLPEEAAAAAAGLLSGAALSAAAAAAAGAALPPMHPAVAAWALRSSRRQVMQRLEAGAATLLSLEAPLQQWQRMLAAAQRQLADEVSAAMPFADGDLQTALGQQQQWLAAAAAHTANLLEVSQAVLQLEASRTADAAPGTAAVGGGVEEGLQAAQQQQEAAQPVDRYSAEQREGWQRYTALLAQMQQLHGAYAAADRSVAAATAELQQLGLRRQEATAIAQSAEEAGSSAAAAFAASALPLVKSTQQLPTAVAQLLPRLAGSSDWAVQLSQAQQWAAELAGAGADGEGGSVSKAAEAAAEQLAAAAAYARELPAAVEQLQAALLPVRNRLLAGGRGETAAKQQAADVIDALSTAVTLLQPQVKGIGSGPGMWVLEGCGSACRVVWLHGASLPMTCSPTQSMTVSIAARHLLTQLEQSEQLQQWLAGLPAGLQALASQAAQQAAALQHQHGFSLHGLEALLQGQAGEAAAPGHAIASGIGGSRALTGSLLLTASPPQQEQEERQRYARTVLRRFQAKLHGHQGAAAAAAWAPATPAAQAAAAGSNGSGTGGAVGVEEEVGRLIAAATSADNLARMWEGWMPWV